MVDEVDICRCARKSDLKNVEVGGVDFSFGKDMIIMLGILMNKDFFFFYINKNNLV